MKTPQLTPYLAFEGNCREAMTFYQQCLGGDLLVQAFEGTPAAEYVPADGQQGVLHASLTNGPLVLFGSDSGCNDRKVTKGDSVSLSLNCSSEAEIALYFARLADGGTVTMPLSEAFWGATFGMLTDRYGMHWLLNYQKEPVQ